MHPNSLAGYPISMSMPVAPGRYAAPRGRRRFAAIAFAGLVAAAVLIVSPRSGEPGGTIRPPRGGAITVVSIALDDSEARARSGREPLRADSTIAAVSSSARAEIAPADPAPTDAPGVGTAGLTAAISGAIADDPAAGLFDLRYREQLTAHLRRFVRYPREPGASRLNGTVRVRARLARDGSIVDLRVVGSAGASLDQAALDSLWRAEPLPAVPAILPVPWEVEIPVGFDSASHLTRS